MAFGVVVLASSSWIFRGRFYQGFHQGSIKVPSRLSFASDHDGVGWGGVGMGR